MSRYNLDDVKAEYKRLDALCGANISEVPLYISEKSSRQLGVCSIRGLNVTKIGFSDVIFDCPEVFYDVIRHEYAHALVKVRRPRERHVHDAVWKSACYEVGCKPCASTRLPDEVLNQMKDSNKYKYALKCSKCGNQFMYSRHCKVIQAFEKNPNNEDYRCATCGCSHLKLEYL